MKMDRRVLLALCLLMRVSVAVRAAGVVRKSPGTETKVSAAGPVCTTTTVNLMFLCKLVVHHTRPLPQSFSSHARWFSKTFWSHLVVERLKQHMCPCPDFELRGFCPSFAYTLARRYSPEAMCRRYRNLPTRENVILEGARHARHH